MTEIYTPDDWLAFFGGSASLFIDDEGYIFTREENYKIMGRSPCGKISYDSGFIYGKDYNSVWPTPIAEMVKRDDVTEVYKYGDGVFRSPILYIKNGKIYSPNEYFRIGGGNASGYIKKDEDHGKETEKNVVTPEDDWEQNQEAWRREQAERQAELMRLRNRSRMRQELYKNYESNPKIVAAATEYAQQRARTATIATILFCIAVTFMGFRNISAEAFLPAVAVVGLFALVFALFIRHVSYKDAFSKKVWELGEQGYGRETANHREVEKAVRAEKVEKAAKVETGHIPTPAPPPKPILDPVPAESKIAVCPHCNAKCRVPAGKGTIQITCPNPSCRMPFIFNS